MGTLSSTSLRDPSADPTSWVDNQNLEEIFLEYKPLLWKLVYGWCISKDDESDLFQEASVGFLKASKTFDPNRKTRFGTHLYNVVKNQLADFYRAQRRSVEGLNAADFRAQTVDEIDQLSPTQESDVNPTQRQVELNEFSDRLPVLLNCLTPRESQATCAVFLAEQTLTETAAAMGVSVPRVSSLIKTSCQKLRSAY